MKKLLLLLLAAVLLLAMLAGCTAPGSDDNGDDGDGKGSTTTASSPTTAPSTKSYKEGQYKVGTDMPAGEYVLMATSDIMGYFCVSTDANGSDIVENDNFNGNSIITVADGQYIKLSRCEGYAYADAPKFAEGKDILADGMYKIGDQLPAGEYKLSATSDIMGYYCIYSSSTQEDIVSNDNFNGDVYVTVEDGQYLKLNRCQLPVQ